MEGRVTPKHLEVAKNASVYNAPEELRFSQALRQVPLQFHLNDAAENFSIYPGLFNSQILGIERWI